MREEEHWLDGMLKEINLPDKIDQVSVYECVFDCDFSKNGLQ
jgi:hypothetical protein